ncbi:MAG: hypothetical protein ACTSPD_16930 [Promethearchaeota archaeon]
MDEKYIFLKIIEQLKESNHSKFKKDSSEFKEILNLSLDEVRTIIDRILSSKPLSHQERPESIGKKYDIKPSPHSQDYPKSPDDVEDNEPIFPFQDHQGYSESSIKNGSNKATQSSTDFIEQGKKGIKKMKKRKESVYGTKKKTSSFPQVHSPSGRKVPEKINPTNPPVPLSFPDDFKPVDITMEEQVITIEGAKKVFSGKTKEFFDWAEKELKSHYSGSTNRYSVPCQICRYYCRECEMQGNVIDNYPCLATCKLLHFNHSRNLSCSKFTLWDKNEYMEKGLPKISKDFFLGYILILCHNHRIAFTQGKRTDIKNNIRDQLYQKSIDGEYIEDLGHSVIIGIDELINREGESIPIGIYISKDHLNYFRKTYCLMYNM